MFVADEILLAKSANDYVKDGLVCWLDGVNNTRAGHDSSATTWDDLSGNNYDFPAQNGNPVWGNDHCAFNGVFQFFRQNDDNVFADVKTAEFCYLSTNSLDSVYVIRNGPCAYDDGGKLLVGNDALNATSHLDMFVKPSGIMSVSYYPKPYVGTCFINGTQTNGSGHTWYGESGRVAVIGNRTSGTGYRKPFKLYSLRLYNRQLSTDEVLSNYLVDAARFGIGG